LAYFLTTTGLAPLELSRLGVFMCVVSRLGERVPRRQQYSLLARLPYQTRAIDRRIASPACDAGYIDRYDPCHRPRPPFFGGVGGLSDRASLELLRRGDPGFRST